MKLRLILAKLAFACLFLVALILQGMIIVHNFPNKAKKAKAFLHMFLFTFAVAGLFAEPVTGLASKEKPTSRRSAKFNYEVGFELVQINFNLTSLFEHLSLLREAHGEIQRMAPVLSTQPGNMAVKSLLKGCEVKTNATYQELIEIENFFFEGSMSQRHTRSIEVLGELWHEVSGSPGPLEYHKEVEASHRIEQTFRHSTATMIDQQKEIKVLGSTLEDEQKEIEKSGKDILSLAKHYKDSYTAETTLSTLLDFDAKCDIMTF